MKEKEKREIAAMEMDALRRLYGNLKRDKITNKVIKIKIKLDS